MCMYVFYAFICIIVQNFTKKNSIGWTGNYKICVLIKAGNIWVKAKGEGEIWSVFLLTSRLPTLIIPIINFKFKWHLNLLVGLEGGREAFIAQMKCFKYKSSLEVFLLKCDNHIMTFNLPCFIRREKRMEQHYLSEQEERSCYVCSGTKGGSS